MGQESYTEQKSLFTTKWMFHSEWVCWSYEEESKKRGFPGNIRARIARETEVVGRDAGGRHTHWRASHKR